MSSLKKNSGMTNTRKKKELNNMIMLNGNGKMVKLGKKQVKPMRMMLIEKHRSKINCLARVKIKFRLFVLFVNNNFN